MSDIDGWVALVFLGLVIGIPMLCWHLISRPRATVKWIQQGGGWPSPAQIDAADHTHGQDGPSEGSDA